MYPPAPLDSSRHFGYFPPFLPTRATCSFYESVDCEPKASWCPTFLGAELRVAPTSNYCCSVQPRLVNIPLLLSLIIRYRRSRGVSVYPLYHRSYRLCNLQHLIIYPSSAQAHQRFPPSLQARERRVFIEDAPILQGFPIRTTFRQTILKRTLFSDKTKSILRPLKQIANRLDRNTTQDGRHVEIPKRD